MASENVYLRGKAKWCYVHQPDSRFIPVAWKVTLYPDDASLEIIRNLKKEGLKNWERLDDDGTHFQFKRDITRKNFKTGQDQALEPVVVLDHENMPFHQNIGNGSDVTIKLEVYSHKTPNGGKAKAARLASVRVENLVPFEKERDFTDEQKKVVAGLPEQPRPRPF